MKEEIKEYLDKVAYPERWMFKPDEFYWIWKSKYDDSYITHFGLEDDIQFLVDRGITDCLQHGVGYSPKNKKWYGWSHRAIYGFSIGSEVKKGDCAYFPANKDDFVQNHLEFWSDLEYHDDPFISEMYDDYFVISWKYNDTVPNETLRNTIKSMRVDFPDKYGRGELVAKTMDDARQMAIDFSSGVS